MAELIDDFDWTTVADKKGFGGSYTPKEREELEKLYDGTLTQVEEKKVLTGVIVGITDREVIVNIGFKSDGLISLSEFRDQNEELKVGQEVEVFIEDQEDKNGQLILSRKKAKIVKAWDNINEALEKDLIIDGFVKRRTKGGLIVDIFGIEAFLPGSQIDVKPIRDFDIFVGKKMEVKVVKINNTNDNVVVSHKVLIEKDIEKQKAEIINAEKVLATRQKTLNEHVNKIRNFESDKKIKNERLKFINDRYGSLQEQIETDKAGLDKSEQSIQLLDTEKQEAVSVYEENKTKIDSLKLEFEGQKQKCATIQEQANVLNNEYKRLTDDLSRNNKLKKRKRFNKKVKFFKTK